MCMTDSYCLANSGATTPSAAPVSSDKHRTASLSFHDNLVL
jgi:hypothetical protein